MLGKSARVTGTEGRSMTEQNNTNDSDEQLRQTSNDVDAEVISGVIIQAERISGGIHQHLPPHEVPVPRQLLAPPRAFVGRLNELAQLTLDGDGADGGNRTVTIFALAGAGGMGKTA